MKYSIQQTITTKSIFTGSKPNIESGCDELRKYRVHLF